MNATINVIFYLKRVKTNAKGLTPIFLRITIDGKRLDKSIGKFIDASRWNSESSKMKGTNEEKPFVK
ncbi:Arm DNA-binding domain-containing protein [Algibacter miyuki]|uniref:Arm DNA-binding domain-containing protein n=1 Tax=Algibacter miyuki TaxID=1306933 RepID=UPI0025B52BEE|nr:Arm DNA-binding domain-containing protein [Algibacter miyuki]MDN3666157.1 Arm DNA-binding domain-containing protein [Algibacter miyuki]